MATTTTISSLLFLFLFYLAVAAAADDKLHKTQRNEKDAKECNAKMPAETREEDLSFVCVCNKEFCDEPEPVGEIAEGQIVFFVSDKQSLRLHRKIAHFCVGGDGERDEGVCGGKNGEIPTLVIDASTRFQALHGFGASFSDAAGINLNALSEKTRERLLRAYFHPEEGIAYSIGRVPIASTDFSTNEYSYVDQEGDIELRTFALAPEDIEAKIPHIKMASRLRMGQPFRLLAAPWASPAWMKTNGRMSGDGELRGELNGPFYRAYANYLKRFFDEYHARGIDFWALSIQNQPESGLEKDFPFQTMFVSNHTQREFAKRLLAPLLRNSPHTASILLIGFDDVREHLLSSTLEIFDGTLRQKSMLGFVCSTLQQLPPFLPEFVVKGAEKFLECQPGNDQMGGEGGRGDDAANDQNPISGIGVHWYTLVGHEQQSRFHALFPDKFILATEACAGFVPFSDDWGPRIGNWTRGWMYGHDIVQNLRNWATGWVDWNLCLDMKGGPNWVENFVDSPVLVDGEKDEFYKQPMFYFLAHFSKFLPPGSVRIDSAFVQPSEHAEDVSQRMVEEEEELSAIDHVAFITPGGEKVLILISPLGAKKTIELRIRDALEGSEANISLRPDSIVTAIWR